MKSYHTRCVHRESRLGTINKLGFFASSVIVAASAAYIYSPANKTYADSTATTRVSVDINRVIALTLDTDDLVLNVPAPTASGVFVQDSINANVTTNSLYGYELYFSTDSNSADMTHEDVSIDDVIRSDFDGAITSSTMAANRWGYSLDGVNYMKIPVVATPQVIRDIGQYPTEAEKQTEIYIGAKISSAVASGAYSSSLVFTAVAHSVSDGR